MLFCRESELFNQWTKLIKLLKLLKLVQVRMTDQLNDNLKLFCFDLDWLLRNENGQVTGHHCDSLSDFRLSDVDLWQPWCEHGKLAFLHELVHHSYHFIHADSCLGLLDPTVDKDQHRKRLILFHCWTIKCVYDTLIIFGHVFQFMIFKQFPKHDPIIEFLRADNTLDKFPKSMGLICLELFGRFECLFNALTETCGILHLCVWMVFMFGEVAGWFVK